MSCQSFKVSSPANVVRTFQQTFSASGEEIDFSTLSDLHTLDIVSVLIKPHGSSLEIKGQSATDHWVDLPNTFLEIPVDLNKADPPPSIRGGDACFLVFGFVR